MNPRHILPLTMGAGDDGHDVIKGEGGCIHHLGPFRRGIDNSFGHQRPGIEAVSALFDQPPALDGDQIRIAGASPDEKDSHSGVSSLVSD